MNHNETIEEATKVMHAKVCCPCDPQGCDWTCTREARYAMFLAEEGLLARPLPTREQIADTIYDALSGQYGDFGMPTDAADAVLALMKGQDR